MREKAWIHLADRKRRPCRDLALCGYKPESCIITIEIMWTKSRIMTEQLNWTSLHCLAGKLCYREPIDFSDNSGNHV